MVLAASVLPAILGCDTTGSHHADGPPKSVELQIKDFKGIMDTVASHRGKVVVMDAWSTQCAPCMQEFPKLVALHHKYPERVACISLSMDYEGLGKPEDQRAKVLEFLRSQDATFDNLLSSEPSDDLYAKFKLPSIPAVFVYDQKGQLAQRFDSTHGKFTYQDVEKKVGELVGKL
ncbi:MAG TPA: TlpA disulfide reductase family protein [Pirellulales bacterium]